MAGAQWAWLDVPFADKDAAKALGARWDPKRRRWYDPRPDRSSGLGRWAARPPVPELLPGEDRSFGSGLFVDPVPSSCWFTNVRSCVDQSDWERLRRMILGRAGWRCEACGCGEDREVSRWLEAHERWAYDERGGVQALRRLICLCSDCHRTTHYGLAQVQGREAEVFAHFCAVTGMTSRAARAHVAEATALWQARSARTWSLDLSVLTGAGITVVRSPPTARERPAAATIGLRAATEPDVPPAGSSTPVERPCSRAGIGQRPLLEGWVTEIEQGVRTGMSELLRARGEVGPPMVHMFTETPRPAYVGSVSCRRFYPGEDAERAVFLLGELPAAVGATRLLVTWEAQDLSAALGQRVDPDGSALIVVDATRSSTVLRWHPLLLQQIHPDGRSLIASWGPVELLADPRLPEPIDELLARWRLAPGRDLDVVVRGLEASGYRISWFPPH